MKFHSSKLSRKDRSHLAQAKRIASTSSCGQMHGCVAVVGGRVVAVGVNSYKNNMNLFDFIPKRGWSVHAEEACLRALRGDARGATLYVARVNRKGMEQMSKPCESCQKKLRAAGVKRVVYTIDNEMEL